MITDTMGDNLATKTDTAAANQPLLKQIHRSGGYLYKCHGANTRMLAVAVAGGFRGLHGTPLFQLHLHVATSIVYRTRKSVRCCGSFSYKRKPFHTPRSTTGLCTEVFLIMYYHYDN